MSNAKIYVGNLSYDTTKEDITSYFSKVGKVVDANLIIDRETGRSKGFAFLTFDSKETADAATKLNGEEFMGRNLKVNIAMEQKGRSKPTRAY